jgi:hypothetical protein
MICFAVLSIEVVVVDTSRPPVVCVLPLGRVVDRNAKDNESTTIR